MQPWRVRTDCGRADLVFQPAGGRKEDLNIGILKSRFQQLYGTWSGQLHHGEERIEFDGVMGLGEDHDCRW